MTLYFSISIEQEMPADKVIALLNTLKCLKYNMYVTRDGYIKLYLPE